MAHRVSAATLQHRWPKRKSVMTRTLVACTAALCGIVFNADAVAHVDMTLAIDGVTCNITSPSGTTAVPCDGASFAVLLQPGWSATIRADIHYTYHDDGLPVDPRRAQFQNDASGLGNTVVDHEAGAIYVASSYCQNRYYCSGPIDTSGTPFAPFFLGNNDVPDDLAGTWSVFATSSRSSDKQTPDFARLNIGAFGRYFSADGTAGLVNAIAAPVPEPGTYALFMAGLGLLGAIRRRARKKGVNDALFSVVNP
jgi:PEP-CTERM motif